MSFSSNLIYHCAKEKISLDFLDRKGQPFSKFMPPISTSAPIGLAQLQAYENGKGVAFVKAIVKGKIKGQQVLVKYFTKYLKKRYPEDAEFMELMIDQMDSCLEDLKGYPDTEPLDVLRGKMFALEGRSAKAYWKAFGKLLEGQIAYIGRERQGATDPVNSSLNYGYGILYGRVWEAITRARLQPGLSYLHTPDTDEPSLSFDLIEEFRAQAVDRAVLTLIRNEFVPEVKKGFLTSESRKKVAEQVLERLGKYERYNGQEHRLQDIIRFQAQHLCAYLLGQDKRYKPFTGTW